MARSPTVNIQVSHFRTNKQQELLKLLNDNSVRKEINTIIKDAINNFVPYDEGGLRRSALVTHKSITWGRNLGYAHYQYEGQVYGPNIPVIKNGEIVRWVSPPGKKKYPTGRRLRYSTPGTQDHWDEAFKGPVKLATNQEITRYLKRLCKERGLKA